MCSGDGIFKAEDISLFAKDTLPKITFLISHDFSIDVGSNKVYEICLISNALPVALLLGHCDVSSLNPQKPLHR